jgi:hypothetical protein
MFHTHWKPRKYWDFYGTSFLMMKNEMMFRLEIPVFIGLSGRNIILM